jgi:hypothetical protein
MTEQAKASVTESVDSLKEYQDQLAQLEAARQQVLDEGGPRWGEIVNQVTEIPVVPKKTDIYVNQFGVAWLPYYQVKSGGQTVEVAAYGQEK